MTNRTNALLWGILGIMLITFISGIAVEGYVLGQMHANRTNPVCHAKTEDSVITDCDYHNGAWYRK